MQIQICCGKFKLNAANLNSPREIKIYHSTFKFTTENSNLKGQSQIQKGKWNSPQWNQNHHGKLKFKFTGANPNSSRQIQIHEGKFKFTTSNSNSPGKLKLTTASSKSPGQDQIHSENSTRQIQIHTGKNLMRQIKNHHIKLKFTTGNSSSL